MLWRPMRPSTTELIRQGTIINPLTERLFREAGLGPGQRVLDIGSGIGEVAMLAARMVGPSGSVVAAERYSATVAAARRRAEQSGPDNVSFIEGDIAKIDGSEPFDAVVFGQKRRES
ncbi:MAG TPA: methyltransferase domain-containing protein, partial [Roseiarcus sp.]|nr:methyltransferase domain-containing protein [Roseiarcus sp.]